MHAQKLFIGPKVRDIRQKQGMTQADFAARLGISTSYFNQIENNQRHVTAAIVLALAREFNVDIAGLSVDDSERLLARVNDVLSDTVFEGQRPSTQEIRLVAQNAPGFINALLAVHGGFRKAGEQLAELDNSIVSAGLSVAPTPYEEVRDFFHDADNYFDGLDREAEALALSLERPDAPTAETLADYLTSKHGVTIARKRSASDAPFLRAYDAENRRLLLGTNLSEATEAFQLAFQIAVLEHRETIDAIARQGGLQSPEAERICAIGLANYFAGALILPYERFADAAEVLRNDIDALASQFGASLEQVAHRLSTLQRLSRKGVPFFFAKLDQAGNITKRHSTTKLQFTRFGAMCPLWNAHRAFETPGRIIRQLAETPDGTRYISIALEPLSRPAHYRQPVRRFALALGCEIKHADKFIYADDLDVDNPAAYEPIGISCRVCERTECMQRAAPPSHARLAIDMNRRDILPYEIG